MNATGKTVASIDHDGWYELRITFTDGTVLDAHSSDEINVRVLSAKALEQLADRESIHEMRFARQLADRERAREIKEARIARAKEILSRRVFEKWRRRVYPTTDEVIKDVWSGPILEQLNASSSLLDRLAS